MVEVTAALIDEWWQYDKRNYDYTTYIREFCKDIKESIAIQVNSTIEKHPIVP